MALSVTMAAVGTAIGGRNNQFTVTVTNTNAAAVTLNSLFISEATESDAVISQPQYLVPNVPVGVGNPVIAASSSMTYGFQVAFTNPVLIGQTPQSQPGGAAPALLAQQADPFFTLLAQGQTSDGSVFSSTLLVPVLSAGQEVPIAQGGAYQFAAGANIINGITLGAL